VNRRRARRSEATLRWETLGVARGLYLRLPPSARLWLRGPELCPPDAHGLKETLA
jgi:hypothetical protein